MSGRPIGVDVSSSRSPRSRWLLALAVLLLVSSSIPAVPASAAHGDNPTSSGGFVTRAGSTLLVDGDEFRFTGLNIYNTNSDGLTCGSVVDLDQALDEIGPGKRVIRAWFFQGLATSGGARDWSRFDATLATAEEHGVKVIPVLANQWADCEQGYGFKTKSWYENGYETVVDPDGLVTYRDWVEEIVTRYADNPTVAFWQLINEAEIQDVQGGNCSLVTGAALTLENWAADVAGLIKSIDSNHLVSLGTIGGGQCGTQGSEYQDVHGLADIDLCEYHDYGSPSVPIPGDQFNGFLVRVSQCAALDKPLFVGETGIIPNDVGGTLQDRADAFSAKLDAQFDQGIAGFLAWAYTGDPSTLNNYDIGAGDPSLGVLALSVTQPDPPPTLRGVNGFIIGGFERLPSSSCNPDGSGEIHYTTSYPVTGPISGTYNETGVITIGPGADSSGRNPITAVDSDFSIVTASGTVTGTLTLAPPRQYTPQGSADFMNRAECDTAYYQMTTRFVASNAGGVFEEGFAKMAGSDTRPLNPPNLAMVEFWVSPEVSLRADYQIDESGRAGDLVRFPEPFGGVPLTIFAFPAPIDPIEVRLFTSNGTALAGPDYTSLDQVVLLPEISEPEQTSFEVIVPVIDDSTLEGTEYFTATIELTTGAALLENSTVDAPIFDNDFQVTLEDVQVTEGGPSTTGEVIVTAIAGEPVLGPIYLCLEASPGGAPASATGADYILVALFANGHMCQPSPGFLTIDPPGIGLAFNEGDTLAANSRVRVTGDALIEYDETIELGLAWIWGATLEGTATATVTIVDDEEHDLDSDGVDDRITTGVAGEFSDGTTSGTIVDNGGLDVLVDDLPDPDGIRITVGGTSGSATISICGFNLNLSAGSDASITCGSVSVTVAAGEVVIQLGDGDGTVTIPQGAAATVSANSDGSYTVDNTGTEDVIVTIGGTTTTVGGQTEQTFVVALAELRILDAQAVEGSPVVFTLSLSAPQSTDLVVGYTSANGSASSPADFAGGSGSVTLPAGAIDTTIPVTTVNDRLAEPAETFSLTINATGVTIVDATAIGTITPDADICTIVGTGGPDVLSGTAGPDVICGGDGNDVINGLGGNDTLFGEAGDDVLRGGTGNDQFSGGSGVDWASYSLSTRPVTVRLDLSTAQGEGNDSLASIENVFGSDLADTIWGNNGANVVQGNGGNDTLHGLAGSDLMTGGAGNDRMFGGDGNDTMLGGTGNDLLEGENGNDTLSGNEGSDQLNGGVGNDTMLGGTGNDLLEGENGNDTLSGNEGSDQLNGGVGNDSLSGGDDADRLGGGAGNDTLVGGPSPTRATVDDLDGGAGASDTCFSGPGLPDRKVRCEIT